MLLCDLIFPQNIPPLTYIVPEQFHNIVKIGQTVVAPLRGKPKKALLWRIYDAEPIRELSEILSIENQIPPLKDPLLNLIQWTAEYYLCNEGQVLRFAQFELFGQPTQRAREPKLKPTVHFALPVLEPIELASKGVTFLRTSSFKEEMAIACRLLWETFYKKGLSAIVLCPERHETEELYALVTEVLPKEQICLYHGMLTRTQRAKAIESILHGQKRVIIGTKSSIFLPLHNLGLIIVLKEHSRQYKQDEVPKLNARDIAIKRASLEGIPVLLTGATPSAETLLNILSKKYKIQNTNYSQHLPFVKILKKGKRLISNSIMSEIKKTVETLGTVMIIEHRLGYGLLQCRECSHIPACPHCNRAMTYHKDVPEGPLLSCHFCTYFIKAPESCPLCKGYSLEPISHGIERVYEELKGIFQNVQIIKEEIIHLKPSTVYLGTLRSYSIYSDSCILIVILNPDLFINLPELKPAERFFQELYYIASQLPKGSTILMQSIQPKEPFYQFLKKWDYFRFIKKEIALRKSLLLPPFRKLISITLHLKTEKHISNAMNVTQTYLGPFSLKGPLVLGSPLKGYKKMLKYMIHCNDKRALKEKLYSLERELSSFNTILRVDVDPYEP